MRIKIWFRTTSRDTRVFLRYNARLASSVESWFSQILSRSEVPGFVFSRIVVRSKIVNQKTSTIRLLSPSAHLLVSLCEPIPEIEGVLESLVGRRAGIGVDGSDLVIEKAEVVEEPNWSRSMRFRMLSPAAVLDQEGRWLKADSPLLPEAIRSDLLERYTKTVGFSPPEDDEFDVVVDAEYVGHRGGGDGVMKVVSLDGGAAAPTTVEAFLCPVTVTGNPSLIAFAHRTGIGPMGPKGFGMMG